jgi:hypothetical protein
MEGKTQEAAAAAAGMCVRSARNWESGEVPSETQDPRSWRTRKDPFEEVWSTEVEPLLKADEQGKLQAKTIFAELRERHRGKFSDGQLRTLQRRVRDWRALHGPEKEVYFEQKHVPGREGAADFTHATELGVTISGVLFAHLLFVFKLSFSGWTRVSLAFAETFEALLRGVQDALWTLGAVPDVLRTDNLSAATHELKHSSGRALTQRFKAVLDHYNMSSTRITPGKSHENGIVEKANDLVKKALEQALILRGSREFESVEAYTRFVQSVVDKSINSGVEEKLAIERAHLHPLPSSRVPEYTVFRLTVRKWSTVRVGHRVYSIPSRLKGHQVEVRQYPDEVEVRYAGKTVEVMPRIRDENGARIDYRHVIWSLVKKPGAFARYKYREELFPTPTFREAYDAIAAHKGERTDIEYVRILHLAASTMESRVEETLRKLLERKEPFDYAAVKALTKPEPTIVPNISIPEPDLTAYDGLLGGDR